jgi:Sec-independent protein translocase protein TatA
MGLDFETLLILAVLAFLLFGPEKLPQYAAKLGYYLAKLREATAELSQQAQASFPPPPPPPAAGEDTPTPALAAQAGVYEHTCPLCTQLVGNDFTFCPKCGHRLKAEEAGPQPPSSQSLAS